MNHKNAEGQEKHDSKSQICKSLSQLYFYLKKYLELELRDTASVQVPCKSCYILKSRQNKINKQYKLLWET